MGFFFRLPLRLAHAVVSKTGNTFEAGLEGGACVVGPVVFTSTHLVNGFLERSEYVVGLMNLNLELGCLWGLHFFVLVGWWARQMLLSWASLRRCSKVGQSGMSSSMFSLSPLSNCTLIAIFVSLSPGS